MAAKQAARRLGRWKVGTLPLRTFCWPYSVPMVFGCNFVCLQVDAATGDRAVYRHRGVPTQQLGAPQQLPKRLLFVLDVSGAFHSISAATVAVSNVVDSCEQCPSFNML